MSLAKVKIIKNVR